tara:strand:+ start:11220 stop:11456 length:237 start_codon:yes stop_codon:yes gene_type:complete
MKGLCYFLNENFSLQVKEYLDSKYGDSEYESLEKANVIALLDGMIQLSVTTRNKPKNTNPDSLQEIGSSWVSIYKKIK